MFLYRVCRAWRRIILERAHAADGIASIRLMFILILLSTTILQLHSRNTIVLLSSALNSATGHELMRWAPGHELMHSAADQDLLHAFGHTPVEFLYYSGEPRPGREPREAQDASQ